MRFWATTTTFAAVFLLFASIAHGQDGGTHAAGVLEEIGALVRKNFYDRRKLGAFAGAEKQRLAAVRPESRPAKSSSATASIDLAARELLRVLGASHTGRYTRSEIDYFELLNAYQPTGIQEQVRQLFPPDGVVSYPGIGIVTRPIDGKNFVEKIYDGSAAQRAEILVGDEILSVDDQPFHPIASFSEKVGQKVRIQLRRSRNGKARTISVEVSAIRPGDMLKEAIRASARLIQAQDKHFCYLKLWTFTGDDVRALVSELLGREPLRSADGLILDLRGRWGGAPPDAAEIFIGRSPKLEFVTPDGQRIPVNVRWRAPLVALVDQSTRSGLELLAYALGQAGVPLIGARTAGAVLGGRAFVLQDKSLLLLAVLDAEVDGKRLEGVGVQPTVAVPFDVRYAGGKDPQLERGIVELLRLVENRGA